MMNERRNEQDMLTRAKNHAYNVLSTRARSEKELTVELTKKRFTIEAISDTITFLKKKGLLDDAKFARDWVESTRRLRPSGISSIRKDLDKKGISSEIIDNVVSGQVVEEKDIIRNLAKDRLKKMRGVPKVKAKRRLFDFLMRRGFNSDGLEAIVDEVIQKG